MGKLHDCQDEEVVCGGCVCLGCTAVCGECKYSRCPERSMKSHAELSVPGTAPGRNMVDEAMQLRKRAAINPQA